MSAWPIQRPRRHALVVDDSPAVRRQLCRALEAVADLHAVEATDGADGWKKLNAGRFELLLTDIQMPHLDGLKLISLVRSGGPHREVPIVVVTTEGADRERALSLGATAYLVKPVRSDEVAEAVRRLLGLP